MNGLGLLNDGALVQEFLAGKEYVIDKVRRASTLHAPLIALVCDQSLVLAAIRAIRCLWTEFIRSWRCGNTTSEASTDTTSSTSATACGPRRASACRR
jgi:hypothetical protein